jgi:hypothetical protein
MFLWPSHACIPVPRFDFETFGGVIEAIHEVEAALSEFKEKVIRVSCCCACYVPRLDG